MNLSANFTLGELTKSMTAERHGISNQPSIDQIDALKILCQKVLQPVRDRFGLTVINSGFRSPELNALLKGSKTSDHMRGMAADIEVPGLSNLDLARWISKNLKYKQLILEFYKPGIADSGWVHVAYDPDDLNHEDLVINRFGTTAGLPVE